MNGSCAIRKMKEMKGFDRTLIDAFMQVNNSLLIKRRMKFDNVGRSADICIESSAEKDEEGKPSQISNLSCRSIVGLTEVEDVKFWGSAMLIFINAASAVSSFCMLCDASEHRGAAREHEIAVEIVADIGIALDDRVARCLVHACALHAQQQTLETSHHCSKKR